MAQVSMPMRFADSMARRMFGELPLQERATRTSPGEARTSSWPAKCFHSRCRWRGTSARRCSRKANAPGRRRALFFQHRRSSRSPSGWHSPRCRRFRRGRPALCGSEASQARPPSGSCHPWPPRRMMRTRVRDMRDWSRTCYFKSKTRGQSYKRHEGAGLSERRCSGVVVKCRQERRCFYSLPGIFHRKGASSGIACRRLRR